MSYDEKATVGVDADGNVLKCAKGAAPGECGYVKGAELCAKCGAMAVEMKMVPAMGDEEQIMPPKKKPVMSAIDEEEMGDEEEMSSTKGYGKPGMPVSADVPVEDMEEEMPEDEEMVPGRKMGKKYRQSMKAMPMDMEDEEDMDEDAMDEEDDEAMPAVRRPMSPAMDEDEMGEDEEEMDEEEDEEEEEEEAMLGEKAFSPLDSEWEQLRRQRISSMGLKSADLGAHGYVCALERKAYAGASPVCEDCPGGCVSEKGMPGILHVEGLAEKMFNGVVIDSGYSSDADMFVVDVQTKDGSVKEVFIDGSSAEIMGFHKLDASQYEQKSDIGTYRLIDFTEAAEIAVKSIDGHVVAVEPDIFEGFDAYAVEIEGFDGKSYDVFVALDGEVLGYDKYELDEAESIEAEAAEIALKRAFSEDRRMELAKDGMAMPDGSYPIVSETDLRNAIQAFGRAKDKEATKKHIMKRARALKMESLIPANWLARSEEKSTGIDDANFMASLVEFQLLEDSIDNN